MIGFALSFLPPNEMELARASLTRVQNELFQVGSELATDRGTKPSWRLVGATEIALLESEIDSMESSLLPLQNFILPGGGRAGAALHLARTMVRRAERECVELMHSETLREELIQYLNRLSDYLFVMARYVNHELNFTETKWFPPKP